MHQASEFQLGSIIRVEMHNFMTYGDVVFNASPRLNIILGQNGSGKSTIACAVCLALGEDVKLLLRGNKLEEFIKYGEREARVKVFLKGETSVITLEVRIRPGVTDYLINNRIHKKEKLRELRRMLKIDLNNLCQFLPQDRVADFVAQNPQKRLREFEKSVGGESLYNTHTDLINTQQQQRTNENEIAQKEQAISTAVEMNATLRREKEKWEKQQQLKEDARLMELHIQMVTCDIKSKTARELKEKIHELKKKLKELDMGDQNLRSQIDAYKTSVNRLNSLVLNEKRKRDKLQHEYENKKEEYRKLMLDLQKAERVLKSIETSRRELKQKLKQKQKTLQGLEEELEQMEDPNTLKERLAKLMQEQTSLKDERDEIQEPLTAAEIKRQEAYSEKRIREVELNKLKNTAKQQMEYVKTVNINAFHALMWIRQNADKFKNAVYGPIFNEVRFANSLHAQWFENCISRTILLSFVTQCKEDYDLLLTEVRDRQGIPINCLIADDNISIRPAHSEEQLRRLKVTTHLANLVECPEVVRRALFNYSSLPYILTAPDNWTLPNTDTNDAVPEEEDTALTVMTRFSQIRVQKSRYVNSITHRKESSVQISDIRPCTIIRSSEVADEERIIEAEQALRNIGSRISELSKEYEKYALSMEKIDKAIRKLDEKKKEIETQRHNRIKTQNTIKKLKGEIERMEEELARDVREDQQKQIDEMNRLSVNRQSVLDSRYEIIQKMIHLSVCIDAISQVAQAQQIVLERLEKEYEEGSRAKKELKKKKEEAEKEFSVVKDEHRKLRSYIYNESGLFRCGNNPNPDEIRCVCNEGQCQKAEKTALLISILDKHLTTDIDECKATLRMIQDKISEIRVNTKSIAEYEAREERIKLMQKELEEMKARAAALVENIVVKEADFKETLDRLVTKLNVNFTLFMANINCKGCVELINRDNFNNIGLDIKVSFRKDQDVQSLNGMVQSGGEKSLSTILFLLSLQEMVSFPFRFIDEINQNMDKRNERYVMQQLLYKGNMPNSHAPQTFIITPKLLTEFPYDDNVTFHIIFQGQYLPAGFSWNTIANYYEEMGSQRVRQLEDSTEQTATNEPSTIQDVEDDSDDLERRANRPTSETKRRRIANDDSE